MTGSSAPRPPCADEPANASSRPERGEPDPPPDGRTDPLAVRVRRPAVGAVALASASAARPAGPWRASACAVAVGIAELFVPPEPPEPPEPTTAPALFGWIVPDGREPFAVGTLSTYWLTAELPGGATVRPWAPASAGVETASNATAASKLSVGALIVK
jgi:hypothetical protein